MNTLRFILALLLALPAFCQAVLMPRSFAFRGVPVRDGLQLWVDATQETGSDSSAVQPLDWSGNGRNLTQSTNASRPLLRTGANGINNRNAYQFDGTDDRVAVAYSQSRPYTIFLVYVSTSNTGRTISSDGLGGGTYNFLLGSHVTGARWWYAGIAVGSAGGSTGTTYLLRAEADTGDSELFSSGSSVGSSAATGNWGTNFNLGASNGALDGGGINEFFTGKVGEVIVYNRILSAGEASQVESYLTAKWYP